MNEKVKELAQAVVETVGDMKFSELINNVEGQMLRDFFYVAKSITTAEESKCKCSYCNGYLYGEGIIDYCVDNDKDGCCDLCGSTETDIPN